MVHATIKQALKSTLQDLSREDFLEFCHQLKDRRKDPLVRYRDVENKSITDLLVSTFTELGALPVALSILKQINCNQEAETLYSETKACVDIKGDPTFRKTSSGELDTKPSQEALNHKAGWWPFSSPVTGKTPEEVEAEAEACVLSEGGDPRNERLLLSRFKIQFGQYRDQTFKWLLENDLTYAAIMVARHEKQRQNTKWQSSLMANKDSLTRYAIAYPEVLKEVRFHRGYERSLQSGQEGEALVGFGKHRSETLQDLYESKDGDKISYVNFLRSKKSTCDQGSKMDIAVRYILKRDKKAAASRKRRDSSDKRTGAPPKVAARRGARPGVGGRGGWYGDQ